MQRGVVRITEQHCGKRVPLIFITQAVIGLRGSDVAREIENASGVIRLPEVIKEDSLFASEFDGMCSFDPLQGRRVAKQRMCEVGINAALGKQRQERLIDANSRNAREAIRGEVRREPNVTERRIFVSFNGGIHSVHAEAIGQQHGRLDCPVVLNPAVLGSGRANKPITLVAVGDDRGCRKHVVMTAITSADFVVGADLMVQLHIELPARIAANNHLTPVGVRKCGARYVW